MCRYLLLLPLSVGISSVSCTPPAEEHHETPEAAAEMHEGSHSLASVEGEFLPIFNGENFDGWTIMGKPEGWSIQDGVIRSEGGRGGDWLRFNDKLDNFIFKVDWKISPGGNSGVYIRSAEEGRPWETGYEVQISNDPRDDLHCTCALYGYAPVDPRPDESADTWHTFEIHADGPHLMVISDGVTCVDVDQSQVEAMHDKPLEGYIGIQDSHMGEGSWVEFRNIQIKLLD